MDARVAIGTLGVALALACARVGAFACADDADCAAARAGTCEATGFCSFPDAGCDSGRRYGAHAGALSESCVPTGETTGIAETGASTTSSPASTDTSAGESTMPISITAPTTSEGGPGESSAGDPSSSDEGTTGPAPVVCSLEGFDDEVLEDGLCTFTTMGLVDVDLVGDALRVELMPAMWTVGTAADGGVGSCVPGDLAGIDVSVALVEVTEGPISRTELALSDGTFGAGMQVQDGIIGAFTRVGDTVQVLNEEEYDEGTHAYVRIEHLLEPDILRFHHSSDGMAWQLVDAIDTPLTMADAVVRVGAGAPDNPLQSDVARFDDVSICLPGA